MTTPVVSIAYHPGYGHTAVIAEAVRSGAVQAGAEVHLIEVDAITEEQWAVLDRSDAIVFGSPTCMGTASAAFHAFAEATSARWATRAWKDKPAAGFTNSGSRSGDKLHTLHTLQFFQILAAQLGTHGVNLGLLPGWNSSTASEDDLNRLGSSSARPPGPTSTRAPTRCTRRTPSPRNTWAAGSRRRRRPSPRAARPWPPSHDGLDPGPGRPVTVGARPGGPGASQ